MRILRRLSSGTRHFCRRLSVSHLFGRGASTISTQRVLTPLEVAEMFQNDDDVDWLLRDNPETLGSSDDDDDDDGGEERRTQASAM